MMRWDVIARLLPARDGRYLEIGVGDGTTASHLCGASLDKVGVDPRPAAPAARHYRVLHTCRSDEFFARVRPERYHVIFIDGLHEAAQVLRDIAHALIHLIEGGTIVIHDCNPQCELEQRVPRPNVRGRWLGDGWRVIAGLRQCEPGLEILVIDTDEGLGIVRARAGVDGAAIGRKLLGGGRQQGKGILKAQYKHLAEARKALLGLVSAAAWQKTPPPWPPRRQAVVTAIFGGYEPLRPPAVLDPAWDYHCVTDDPQLAKIGGWRVIVQPPAPHARRASREIKCRIHRYAPGAEVTVWIDGSFQLLVSPTAIVDAMGDAEIGAFTHDERSDIYSEGLACQALGKGESHQIEAQLERYRKRGYESRWLVANGILVRRMTEAVITHGERWWQEIEAGSERDQVSFPVVCDELGIVPRQLPMCIRKTAFAHFLKQGLHARRG